MKSFKEFMTEGKIPPHRAAKEFKHYYKGYDPHVETPDGKHGAHVFEFPHESHVNKFLDRVGGAPHPLGGHRVILR